MTDAELRAIVRDAVARHMGGGAPASDLRPAPTSDFRPAPVDAQPFGAARASGDTHASHAMYLTLVNVGDACLIEPAVACNHCGYCKSHGH